jgi:hypothetical protein
MSASTSVPLLVSTREYRRSRAGDRVRQRQQIDLFGDEGPSALVPAPAWRELPVETQAVLTSLMVQLILKHVQGSRTGSVTEAGHGL